MKKSLSVVLMLMVVGTGSFCFAEGYDGTKKYDKEDTEQLKKRCDGGDAEGCFILGKRYEEGNGVGQDKYRAATLYTQACNGGNGYGCSNMALRYDTP